MPYVSKPTLEDLLQDPQVGEEEEMPSITPITEEQMRQTAMDVARQYLQKTKRWKPEEYYLEIVSVADAEEPQIVVLDGVYQADLRGTQRGGGQSVQLHVDIQQRSVLRELAFQ
jgi:hypothetical protein